ncbi:MAG: translation initiation factor IF-2, partial [Methylococcales bacterium]|nr:translation initiation factor IF-2 [Methylococcales bacterium]
TAKLENDAAEKVAELARVEEAGITPEPKAETVAAETVSSVEPVVETKPEPVDVKPEVSTEKKKEKHFKAAPPAAKKPDEKEKRRVPEGKPKPKQKGRKNYFVEDDGSKSRGAKRKKKKLKVAAASEHQFEKPTKPVTKEIAVPEAITVSELAQRMSIKAAEVIKKLMTMGTMATINHVLDQDTAMLVTEELGHVAVVQVDNCAEQKLFDDADSGQKVPRAPVVTIMGHVDHGKTSLLDYIRTSRVADREAGGITQHIGAYHVDTPKGMITFLDTPGHAAFTAMRSRGAEVTDIVILVVAADDGVMPQTQEAIQHAKAAGVPLIVAVNKIDKPDSDPEKVKQELAGYEVVPDEWGGDVMFANVSAKTGEGVDALLDTILLQSEMLELKGIADGRASGTVIEASLDKGRGPVATILVQKGTLNKGDVILCGQEYGRVRAMFDETGQSIDTAGPSIPVVILGLSASPCAGDDLHAVADERQAREITQKRRENERNKHLVGSKPAKLEDIFSNLEAEKVSVLNVLIKADVQGSVEAIKDSLTKLSTDEVAVKVLAAGVGGISESDINLAAASSGIVIAFNVRADASARQLADEKGLDLRYYSVIYEAIDDVRQALSGLLSPEVREEIVGLAEVREVYKSSKLGAIAGSMVIEGTIRRHLPIRVLRDNVVIYEGVLESLRRFKDDMSDVKMGMECGIGVKNYNDVKPGDQIEVFERNEIARTL